MKLRVKKKHVTPRCIRILAEMPKPTSLRKVLEYSRNNRRSSNLRAQNKLTKYKADVIKFAFQHLAQERRLKLESASTPEERNEGYQIGVFVCNLAEGHLCIEGDFIDTELKIVDLEIANDRILFDY